MTAENLPIPEAEIAQTEAPIKEPEKTYTKEDMERAVRDRLKRERMAAEEKEKEIADLRKKLQALENKVERGTATQDEQLDYQAGKKASQEAQQQGINPDDLPYIVEQTIQERNFFSNIEAAMKEDPEFKKLIEDQRVQNESARKGDRESIPLFDPQAAALRFEKNGAAILKHLLKDKKDRELYLYALNDYSKGNEFMYKKFMSDLDEKVMSGISKPRPNNYTPAPRIGEVGQGDDEFDIDAYVKKTKTRN